MSWRLPKHASKFDPELYSSGTPNSKVFFDDLTFRLCDSGSANGFVLLDVFSESLAACAQKHGRA